jgi:hypothetical protein
MRAQRERERRKDPAALASSPFVIDAVAAHLRVHLDQPPSFSLAAYWWFSPSHPTRQPLLVLMQRKRRYPSSSLLRYILLLLTCHRRYLKRGKGYQERTNASSSPPSSKNHCGVVCLCLPWRICRTGSRWSTHALLPSCSYFSCLVSRSHLCSHLVAFWEWKGMRGLFMSYVCTNNNQPLRACVSCSVSS